MLKRKLPSATLGALTPSEVTEGSSELNEEDPSVPFPVASPTQVSPWAVTPEVVPSIAHIRWHPQGATLPEKEGGSVVKPLKENHQEAFSKESERVRVARQDYYKTHQPNYEHEGSYYLSSTFRNMATSATHMGSEIHKVWEVWTSQKDLRADHHVAKTSPRTFVSLGSCHPPNHPRSWAWGDPFPKPLWRQGELSFCLWCRKGQNDGLVVNDLWTSHYHLGLICNHCMEYFTVSTNTMHWHS